MLSWVPQQRSYSIIKLPSDKALWASLSAFSSQPFIPNGSPRKWVAQKNYQGIVVKSVLAKIKNPPSPTPETLVKERHKYFDEVIITVRAGDGGHGAILSLPNQKGPSKSQGKFEKEKTKKKSSYKRDFDGSLILPVGGHGGDVIIYADESKDTLWSFTRRADTVRSVAEMLMQWVFCLLNRIMELLPQH
ncbi:UNVERIFIED_CONTAM: putative GTP-binding protein OBGC2 [Sesamum latifolium]|uniref:GTP-binding protein OBGC2 n=1 Tax=Sesamum latifolium TaxID=2727402 RepID=A0AAW2W9H8_9LAMI